MNHITLATVPREEDRKITIPAWFAIELAIQLYQSATVIPQHRIKRRRRYPDHPGAVEERQKLMEMIKGTRFDPEIPGNIRIRNVMNHEEGSENDNIASA